MSVVELVSERAEGERGIISIASPDFSGAELAYVTEALKTGRVTGGCWVRRFEERLGHFLRLEPADVVALSSATAALHLALWGLHVGRGEEVIVPALTFIATANAAVYCGAKVRVADVDPQTWCLDPESAQRLVNGSTRAIIPVDLFGYPFDMDQLRSPLPIIEDAAEALGASRGDVRVGSHEAIHAAVFSFYGNKVVTCAEGGALVTHRTGFAKEMRRLATNCTDPARRYRHQGIGFNYRQSDLHAALGCAQLERLDDFLDRRARIADWYRTLLRSAPVTFQQLPHDGRHAHWAMPVLLPSGVDADSVRVALQTVWHIETRPFFTPISLQAPYNSPGDAVPVATQIARRGILLPMHVHLSEDDVVYICDALLKVMHQVG